MADNDSSGKQIIQMPEREITLWRPHRALPILGAATILWAGRRVLRYGLRYALKKKPEVPVRVLESVRQPQNQEQKSTGYTVTYHYQARWTLRIQPEDET